MKNYYYIFFLLLSMFAHQTSANTPESMNYPYASEYPMVQQEAKVSFYQGQLRIQGIDNIKAIEVFDVLGKRVFLKERIANNVLISLNIPLKANNIYIVRVHTSQTKESFRIVAL